MDQKSIRDIFAEEFGDALKPRFRDQAEAPEPQAAPMALNDNRALKAAILDAIENEPTQAEHKEAAAAKQNKAALREQILNAIDFNNENGR